MTLDKEQRASLDKAASDIRTTNITSENGDFDSVKAEKATINNTTLNADGEYTEINTNSRFVDSDDWSVIFNRSEAVDVVGGFINGPKLSAIEYRFDDGSTFTHGDPDSFLFGGKTDDDAFFRAGSILPAKDVTRLRFYNNDGNRWEYGFGVVLDES